ncbi:hypothetical protein HK104_003459 [Borealophlyctis nickersoniae]|nr:hypothetical protein HK104_003459 [Borealophlyctis nickersoniae]
MVYGNVTVHLSQLLEVVGGVYDMVYIMPVSVDGGDGQVGDESNGDGEDDENMPMTLERFIGRSWSKTCCALVEDILVYLYVFLEYKPFGMG